MYYKPKHFKVKELVPSNFYIKWGEQALQFIDSGLLHDLDIIREEIGLPIIVNGVGYNWSGLRTSDWEYFNPTSLHSLGKAVDFKLLEWIKGDLESNSPDTIRRKIVKMKAQGKLKYITGLEAQTNSWVHIDTRNREPNDESGLFVFNP